MTTILATLIIALGPWGFVALILIAIQIVQEKNKSNDA